MRWRATTSPHPARRVTARVGILLAAAMQVADAGAAPGAIRFPLVGLSLAHLSFAPAIPVPNDPSVGEVLGTASHAPGIATPNIHCRVVETAGVNGTPAPGHGKVFMTSVRGLGVRYSIRQKWAANYTAVPFSRTFYPPIIHAAPYDIMAELVVTGPLGSGMLSAIPSLAITFSGPCFDTVTRTQYVTAGSRLTAGTCSVTTRSIQVALLPRVSPANLADAAATPFFIGLDCAAPTRAYLTLDDASNPGNRSTILSAAPGSTAKGVGMQIMSGSRAVSFGAHAPESGNLNVWFVGRMRAGANRIPLSARYVRTGPVSGGTVKGLATFTMTYQ